VGLQIPQDIAVIGFGDFDFSRLMTPALTSVYEPIEDMAAKAVNMLIEKIEKPEMTLPLQTIFPTRLEIRESCKRERWQENGKRDSH
jgi:DNA-binding LacI/PurR family transcriptional regulator